MKKIIVILEEGKRPILRTCLTALCEEFGLPYHTLKGFKFPFEFENKIFYKEPLKSEKNGQ